MRYVQESCRRVAPYYGAGILFAFRDPAGGAQVLLFRRTILPDAGYWSIVGGRKERDESFAACAVREAQEEACHNIAITVWLRDYLSADFALAHLQEHRVFRQYRAASRSPFWLRQALKHVLYQLPCAFQWRTYLIEFMRQPPASQFSLNWENDAVQWFDIHALPSKTHPGVCDSIQYFKLYEPRPQG